jgi:hypothetical protein
MPGQPTVDRPDADAKRSFWPPTPVRVTQSLTSSQAAVRREILPTYAHAQPTTFWMWPNGNRGSVEGNPDLISSDCSAADSCRTEESDRQPRRRARRSIRLRPGIPLLWPLHLLPGDEALLQPCRNTGALLRCERTEVLPGADLRFILAMQGGGGVEQPCRVTEWVGLERDGW